MRLARTLATCAMLAAASTSALHAQVAQKKNPPATAARPANNAPAANASLPPLTEARPGLETRAIVKLDAATQTAMKTMPNTRITARRIEEHGTDLIYVFKMRAGNQDKELWINAATGAVVPTTKMAAPGRKGG